MMDERGEIVIYPTEDGLAKLDVKMRGETVWLSQKIIGVVFAGFVLLVVAFAVGVEVGHRRGYDEGWRDCKHDAKETLFEIKDAAFWNWHGSSSSRIRKRRSFWFD